MTEEGHVPPGFQKLMNKMLRSVLLSRPLHLKRFLAEFLEAEMDKRTLSEIMFEAIIGDSGQDAKKKKKPCVDKGKKKGAKKSKFVDMFLNPSRKDDILLAKPETPQPEIPMTASEQFETEQIIHPKILPCSPVFDEATDEFHTFFDEPDVVPSVSCEDVLDVSELGAATDLSDEEGFDTDAEGGDTSDAETPVDASAPLTPDDAPAEDGDPPAEEDAYPT